MTEDQTFTLELSAAELAMVGTHARNIHQMFTTIRSLTFAVASLSLFACAMAAEPDESSNESAPSESAEPTDQATGLHSTQRVIYGGNNCWCHSGYYTCGVLGTSTCCDRYACMTATGLVYTSSPQN